MPTKNIKGEKAMQAISDHPLYASTSGISYEQAIAVAVAIFGKDWEAVVDDLERFNKLSVEEQKKELGL